MNSYTSHIITKHTLKIILTTITNNINASINKSFNF